MRQSDRDKAHALYLQMKKTVDRLRAEKARNGGGNAEDSVQQNRDSRPLERS